ncbi:hypothetical protein BFR06_20370 [Burkholderia pseudomallei]|nr:hypothetical protein BFR05_20360 [Burkholderia pseudomallei]APG00304.1 hypothetical protein BFR06_20370 [Burkholderia pseudomallei]KEO70077.1 hypothetical protein J103_08140 [Burkholderia pseudomallei MSHR5855]KVO06432.1 hypothetical protein WJ71_09505 [Burkholderia ubonensis]
MPMNPQVGFRDEKLEIARKCRSKRIVLLVLMDGTSAGRVMRDDDCFPWEWLSNFPHEKFKCSSLLLNRILRLEPTIVGFSNSSMVHHVSSRVFHRSVEAQRKRMVIGP